MAEWICANCGAEHESNNQPCRECAHERFAKLEPKDSPKQIESSPTTIRWKCEECGKEHVNNNPPCSRCGNAPLQKVEAEAGTDEIDPSLGPTTSRRGVVKYGAAIAGVLAVGGYFLLNRHSANFRDFRSRIKEAGIDVKSLTEEKRRWVLEYFVDWSQAAREFGTIGLSYAETVPSTDENPDHQLLDVIVFRPGGQREGSFTIQASSARAYNNGRISRDDYIRSIVAASMR